MLETQDFTIRAYCRESGALDQSRYSVTGLLGDLELHRSAGLLLHDRGSRGHTDPMSDVAHAEPHKVAAPQFAINCQVEKGKIPGSFSELQPDPNGPDLLPFERRLLTS
jgi:hypothetical protein